MIFLLLESLPALPLIRGGGTFRIRFIFRRGNNDDAFLRLIDVSVYQRIITVFCFDDFMMMMVASAAAGDVGRVDGGRVVLGLLVVGGHVVLEMDELGVAAWAESAGEGAFAGVYKPVPL